MPTEALPVYRQEEQLLEALPKLAPPDAWLLVVNSRPGPAGTPLYAGTYLTRSAEGEWAAGSLPDLPAALRKRFVALLAAVREEDGGAAWDACLVTLPLNPLEAYRYDVQQKVVYGCRTAREGSVDPADHATAYELPTPDALLAQMRAKDAELDRRRRLSPEQMEQAMLLVLLPALPADTNQVLLRYEVAAATTEPAASLQGLYLSAGEEARAQPLPALPNALLTAFADFRVASIHQSGEEWASVELLARLVPDEYGDDKLERTYAFDRPEPLRGLLTGAAAGESPAAFATRVREAFDAAANEDNAANNAADYRETPAAARSTPTAAPAAKPTTWVCTWCKQTYVSTRQPTSFQPGKCLRNPGKAHAWHK